MNPARRAAPLLLTVALVACAPAGTPTDAPTDTQTDAPAGAASTGRPPAAGAAVPRGPGAPSGTEVTVDPTAQPAVDAAIAAYAAALGVPEAEVAVVSVTPVTWPDSSLGCGQPDQSYLQVLTPGYRVVLQAGGQRATYHTSDGSMGSVQVVRCESSRQLNLGALGASGLDLARRDLAERLGGAEVTLVSSGIAPVTQLACDGTPEPTGAAVPAIVVFEFILGAGDTQHQYRAAGERFIYCGPYEAPQVDEAGNPTE
jgi:hypothetical protein